MRTVALALLALAGCIDEFRGSNVQVDFAPAMPVQASAYAAGPGDGELPNDIHFTLYAFDEGVDAGGDPVGRLFELQKFEIHRLVDLESPCFIDVGDHVPFEGLHVSEFANKVAEANGIDDITMPPPGATEDQLTDVATAMQRQLNVSAMGGEGGPKAVTSVSASAYGAVGATCDDPSGFPPPECTDSASNARRLEMCQAAWDSDPRLFEGTDRVLTAPLNGTTHGMVTGMNPVNLAPIGGAQFFVDESLEDFTGFAIYWKQDAATDLGELLLYGEPEAPTRGVIRVRMRSLIDPAITADMAIFSDIDDDEVHF